MNNNTPKKTISLFSQPYLDNSAGCYKNIITLNTLPQGPLGNFVKKIKMSPLSHFKNYSNKCEMTNNCCLALSNKCIYMLSDYTDLMMVDDVPNLISYLLENKYTIDTSITKMFNESDIRFKTNNANELICFITYMG
jgi:hypothetical protein